MLKMDVLISCPYATKPCLSRKEAVQIICVIELGAINSDSKYKESHVSGSAAQHQTRSGNLGKEGSSPVPPILRSAASPST